MWEKPRKCRWCIVLRTRVGGSAQSLLHSRRGLFKLFYMRSKDVIRNLLLSATLSPWFPKADLQSLQCSQHLLSISNRSEDTRRRDPSTLLSDVSLPWCCVKVNLGASTQRERSLKFETRTSEAFEAFLLPPPKHLGAVLTALANHTPSAAARELFWIYRHALLNAYRDRSMDVCKLIHPPWFTMTDQPDGEALQR